MKTVNVRSPIVIHYVIDMERGIAFYRSVFNVVPSFQSAGWTTLNFGVPVRVAAFKDSEGNGFELRREPHLDF